MLRYCKVRAAGEAEASPSWTAGWRAGETAHKTFMALPNLTSIQHWMSCKRRCKSMCLAAWPPTSSCFPSMGKYLQWAQECWLAQGRARCTACVGFVSIWSQSWPGCRAGWEARGLTWPCCSVCAKRQAAGFKVGWKAQGWGPPRKESATIKGKKGMKSPIASQGCILKCHLIGFQARKVSGPVSFQ